MNRSSIQVAVTGNRPLLQEDLTTAFYQLLRRVEAEEAFTNSLHKTVASNAELLDQVQHRAAQAQASLSLVGSKFEQTEAAATGRPVNARSCSEPNVTYYGEEFLAHFLAFLELQDRCSNAALS